MSNRIMYLRDSQYRPVGCLAISVDRKRRRLNYQYSVLNPHDAFDRKMARQLALGRMLDVPVSLPYKRGDVLTMHDISFAVMRHLANSDAPNRAVKAAKLWLSMNELQAAAY